MSRPTNWAGNVEYVATALARPKSVTELQELVANAPRARAIGAGHSFTTVGDGAGTLVSLAGLPREVTVDPVNRTVTVMAGMTYGEVAAALHAAGWALPNLASLPQITIAGACATGTHGSGDHNQVLAAAVRSMSVVGPDGSLVELSTDSSPDWFHAARVGLGGMGIAVAMTLDVEPTFDVEQQVYLDLSVDTAMANLDEILSSAHSVSLFTDFSAPHFDQVWRKARTSDAHRPDWPDRWFGSRFAELPVHPVPGMDAATCTPQLGQPGPWSERLCHFRVDVVPSAGAELQSEYLVARSVAVEAFEAILSIGSVIAPALQISELRSVAADYLWLSPASGRDTVAFHFTWHPDPVAVNQVLRAIEVQLEPFDARPHWAKIHRFSPERLAHAYPRLPEYQAERHRFDPTGVFTNEILDSLPHGQYPSLTKGDA